MLDFAQNFNIYKVEGIENIISNDIDFVYRYPDHKHQVLIKSISDNFKVPEDSIAIGNGTTEIIFTLARIIEKNKVVIGYPTFWEYTAANEKNKRNSIQEFFMREDVNFALDFKAVESSIVKPSVVYLCNPNNPTSVLTQEKSLRPFIEDNPETDFVVDETYMIFREDYDQQSLLKESVKLKNLYVVTSLSKMFFMPGLRVGFLCSHPENIKKYYNGTIPYLTNPLAEKVVPFALKKEQYIKQTRAYYSKQRSEIFDLYDKKLKNNIKVFKPDANFILLKILTNRSSTDVVRQLNKRGMVIRDGNEFKGLGNKWLRVGIRSTKENKQLLTTLQQILV